MIGSCIVKHTSYFHKTTIHSPYRTIQTNNVTVDSDFSKNISVSFILSVSAFNSGEKRGKVIQRELESERNEEAKKMGVQHKQEQSEEIDYTEVVKSNKFQKLISDRKKFIIPYTVFFLIFYFLLPIATSYTTFLN